jgi:O-antigen ligase
MLTGTLALALAIVSRPVTERSTRPLDCAIGAALAVCAIQLVPLPTGVVSAVSPMRGEVERALRLDGGRWLTLSLSPADSWHALAVFGGSVLTYLAGRTMFASRGVRGVCRAVAWLGLLLAGTAIAQRVASPDRIFGTWEVPAGAFPFGPFVNRNHCATWLLMAIPLVFGYAGARVPRPSGAPRTSLPALVQAVDGRTLVLLLSSTVMTLALMLSMSRSGLVAFGATAAVFAVVIRPRVERTTAVVTTTIAAIALGVAVWFADTASLMLRFSEQIVGGRFGRLAIWQDTFAIVRDFWLTGVGVGSYATAMVLYQTGERTYHYNQAHNHYVQVAAEGGILLTGAVAAGGLLLARLAWRHLRADRSGVFWIRAGAAAGLAGVAVQSLWETGLRMPANAQLAAVLAALLTQHGRGAAGAESGTGRAG